MRYLICLSLILFLVACNNTSEQEHQFIDLRAHEPIPLRANNDIVPLHVSVAAVISPQGTSASYQLLLDYLSEVLHRPVELVQRRTYQETNELIRNGEVDLAFVCTSAYVLGHDTFGMELLAAPQVQGESSYYSLLIVPKDSTATSMEDLEGKVFAFTDPMSNTGRAYPSYLVMSLGRKPDEFFSRTFFTYSHDKAIYAVASGLADGAAVDSLVYKFALSRDPSLSEKIKVIHQSPAFAIPPVVISPSVRPQQRAILQDALLTMHESELGREALNSLGFDKFVIIEDEAYDDVRDVIYATVE